MPTTLNDPTLDTPPTPNEEHFRPLYLRRVPEHIWILVHDNAIRSRMRLQDYLVMLMQKSEPFPPRLLPAQAQQSRTQSVS